MGLRTIIRLFVVLFVSTKANTIQDGDGHYEHMLELIIGLQSTIINLESTVVNLEGVVCKQTTELEHLKEKVEKLEEMEGFIFLVHIKNKLSLCKVELFLVCVQLEFVCSTTLLISAVV